MDDLGFFALLGLFVFFGSLFGFIAFFSRGPMRRELDELRQTLHRQAVIIDSLQKAIGGVPEAAEPSRPTSPPEPQPLKSAATPASDEAPSAPVISPPAEPPRAAPPSPPPPKPPKPSFEEQLTSRWLVWLGALTIGLGGVFLVKFSIDYGLITPEMRVIFGFLLGVALVAGGEWLRRSGAAMKIEALRGSYVPPALTAAGLFVAFASVYAAFALYQMLSPLASFIVLAALSLAAIVLSIWHGRGVALLGLLGGFVTPLLIPSDQPSAWALFLYLGALVVALVTLIRFLNWFALLWPLLLGIAFWIIAWLSSQWSPSDMAAIGLFFFVATAAFCAAFWDAPASSVPSTGAPPPPLDLPPALLASLAVVFVGALATFDMEAYGVGSIVVLAALAALQLAIALRADRLASLALTAALLVIAAFLRWPAVALADASHPPVLAGSPSEGEVFLWTLAAFGAAFAVAGFAKIWRGRRVLLWAWLSAATSLTLFALAYGRIVNFQNDLVWAMTAVTLAFVALAAVERCLVFRERPGMIEAAGAYATAVIAALGLGLAMVLEEAWLTVALSLLPPALAWTDRRLDIPAHRRIALVVTAIVLVRLVFNPDILSYEAHAIGGASWVLYGYGVPALACFFAAQIFAEKARDQTVAALESAALLFVSLFAFFEIRALATGSLSTSKVTLFEASLHTLTFGLGAYGLERAAARTNNIVASVGWRIEFALATFNLVIVQLIARNPLFTDEPMGDLPLVNLLLLAYAAPVVLAVAFMLRFREREPWRQPIRASSMAAVTAFVFAFVWLSLETRRFFRGSVLSEGAASDAELYAYSVMWLIYAGVLLALAIRYASSQLRWASLVVLAVTVAKVFLSDMSVLTGLWRVASFIGVGLTLVGIGFLYQRYVFPHTRSPDAEAQQASGTG